MRPVVRTALLVAGLAAIIQIGSWLSGPSPEARTIAVASATATRGQCPAGTLPDGRACIPVPEGPVADGDAERRGADESWIPRRPDRPESYERYRWPVELSAEGVLPSDANSPGGLVFPEQRGTEVRSRQLLHQVGDAEVLAITDLIGTTVITLHTLRHPGGLRQYVVLYGHLGETDPGLKQGTNLRPDAVIGKVGDSGRPGYVGLYLEVRQVRRNIDLTRLPVAEIRHPARTVACDARNVFPER